MHDLGLFLQLAIVAFALKTGTCFPDGPPPSTCTTLFPKHGVEKQTGTAPYTLTLSQATYTPGQNITVEVSGNGTAFTGFQVTAHRVSSSGNAEDFIGTFTPSENSGQVIACLGQPRKMWAHNDGGNKTRVTATWTAPDSNQGDLQFFLTVVEHKLTFWHRIPRLLLAEPNSTVVVAPEHKVPAVSVPTSLSPDWTECGDTKGCWLVPESGQDSCSGDDCKAALSYQKQGNLFVMEMTVKGQDNYISVGFSDDKKMGDDQTVTCTATPGHESVQVGYNPMKYNDRQLTMGVRNLTVGQVDGQAYCRFTREAVLTSLTMNGDKTFDLTKEFYLFLAWGHIYDGTDVIGKHQEAPAISSEKMDLKVIPPISGAPAVAISNILSPLFVALFVTVKTWC